MKLSKNTLALVLIVSSIIFLLALQVFWLRSSYKNEISDLRKESNGIFKNTVFQLRDSIFYSSLSPYFDSVHQNLGSGNIKIRKVNIASDTLIMHKKSSVQVFISSMDRSDSLINALKPLTQKLKSMQKESAQNFTIRIAADSIHLDTLQYYFKNNLLEANIGIISKVYEIKFSRWNFKDKLHSVPPPPMPLEIGEYYIPLQKSSLFSDTLRTEPVRLNPAKLYQAQLTGVRSLIIKKITPQILFSVFLTLLTTAAFVIMYRSIRTQQRLMELKNDFISNVTHELKTPVATVSVALEALKNFHALDKPELTKEYLDIAQNELNRLTLMTDKILKAAVFESKGVEFISESVNLATLVDQILLSLKLILEKRGARVSFTKVGIDFDIIGSGVHLTNVVYNLLDNALKYSYENPQIEISLREDKHQVEFTLSDHGIGIDPSHQKKIFEKFYRVPSGDVHNTKGYGLGLSYVASVIKSHNGKISVKSEPGKGTTFILTLPKLP